MVRDAQGAPDCAYRTSTPYFPTTPTTIHRAQPAIRAVSLPDVLRPRRSHLRKRPRPAPRALAVWGPTPGQRIGPSTAPQCWHRSTGRLLTMGPPREAACLKPRVPISVEIVKKIFPCHERRNEGLFE